MSGIGSSIFCFQRLHSFAGDRLFRLGEIETGRPSTYLIRADLCAPRRISSAITSLNDRLRLSAYRLAIAAASLFNVTVILMEVLCTNDQCNLRGCSHIRVQNNHYANVTTLIVRPSSSGMSETRPALGNRAAISVPSPPGAPRARPRMAA